MSDMEPPNKIYGPPGLQHQDPAGENETRDDKERNHEALPFSAYGIPALDTSENGNTIELKYEPL
jgi:hypothetical protein